MERISEANNVQSFVCVCTEKAGLFGAHSLRSKWLPAKRKIVAEVSKCKANAWLPAVVRKHLYIHYIQGESCGCVLLLRA